MKKILVPTDFSETANKARDYAVQLAQELNAEVILLNAYLITPTGMGNEALLYISDLAQSAENQMKMQLNYLNLNFSNIKFKSSCISGYMEPSIQKFCEHENINLIVMGTTGASGFLDNIIGSKTASLIGSIKIPVIAVPSKATINFPKKIVVANDLTVSGDEKLFLPLKEIAIKTKSTIDFLVIVDDEHKINHKIQRLKASNFDDKFDVHFHPFHFRNDENIENGIREYINNHDVDLLTVVSHQRTFWQNLFHNSVSKALTKHLELPILILSE
jgi:nucleotide-binding universal stress UspA family protein